MTDTPEELPCGCTGKTALDRIVYPARERVRDRLADAGVHLMGRLECGLLPRRTNLDRTAGTVSIADGTVEQSWNATSSTEAWGLAAVLAAGEDGSSVGRFADVLEAGYTEIPVSERLLLAKGHSVQVDADRTTLVVDRLRPRGERRPGYVVANVDVIHGFPGLDAETEAVIAGFHALNDCYAYGATNERTLRPVVGVPVAADSPSATTVRAWFRDGLPGDVELLSPTVVRHGGRGWLFGANVTTEVEHTPPMHSGRVESGDAVLLHRPFGAVAALTASRDADDATLRNEAVSVLDTDHNHVGETVAAFCPDVEDQFDPTCHLKVATDVSGPGIGGIAEVVAQSGHRLHVESLPFVDSDAVGRARRRWLVPDATVGTNGPIAMVGRPDVLDRVKERLRRSGEDPVWLGHVEATDETAGVSTADGVRLDQVVEDATLHRTSDGILDASPNHD